MMVMFEFGIIDLNKKSKKLESVYFKEIDYDKSFDSLNLMSESLKCCMQSIEDEYSINGSDFLVKVADHNGDHIQDFTFFLVHKGDENNG